MSILTPFFNLFKVAKTDPYDIEHFNDNMDIIDTELHRPPLTVNNVSPDPTTRNIPIQTVPLADNLTSDEAQINDGLYIVRTSGGEASIDSGTAFLSSVKGYMVKTGYSPEVCDMDVRNAERPDPDDPEISAVIDVAAFRTAVDNISNTYYFIYTSSWDHNPGDYGITVTGTPYSGDTIVVTFVAENRGTITAANPAAFISTGWNLYNNEDPKIRVCRYSETYGYKISGDYSLIQFATTETSTQKTQIIPVEGNFNVPSDGWLFISGGNATNTMVWTTWSDWTLQPNGGVFEPYTETEIDLSGVMANFPAGLMKIGNVEDEINLNTGVAYSRIVRLTIDHLEEVIESGVPYDTDTNYVYAVRENVVSYDATGVSGAYSVSDHGMEYYTQTTVAVESQSLYGQDLKNKLRRDVLTISPMTLTDQQKEQVLAYTGATDAIEAAKNQVISLFDDSIRITSHAKSKSISASTSGSITAADFLIEPIEGFTLLCVQYFSTGNKHVVPYAINPVLSGTVMSVRNVSSSAATAAAKLRLVWVRTREIHQEEQA